MELRPVIIPGVATVRWKLADFMKQHEVTAYELGVKLGGHTKMSKAYRLANATDPPSRVDFETLGEVMRSLSEITGKRVTFEDLLEYQDD